MARLAIQCILYKSSGNLPTLLESLKTQTFTDFDVWFYENSESAEESKQEREMVESSGISAHFIEVKTNIGFAGGHQALFVQHDAPFVLLLNDDVRLEPEYLFELMKRIESDQKIASVTGLVFRWTEGERIIDTAGLEYRSLGKIVDRFAGMSATSVAGKIAQDSEVFGVSGAIGLYRRRAIDLVGGLFDPSWFMYKEDADLAIRLRGAGFSAWFEPKAIAFHRRGLKEEGKGIFQRLRDERKRSPKLRAYSYANQWKIYRRHFRFSLGVKDIVSTIAGEVLRSGMVFLADPRVFFRAWKMILTSTPYAS